MPPAPRQRTTSKRAVPANSKPGSVETDIAAAGFYTENATISLRSPRGAIDRRRGVLARARGPLSRRPPLLHLVPLFGPHRQRHVGAPRGARHAGAGRHLA